MNTRCSPDVNVPEGRATILLQHNYTGTSRNEKELGTGNRSHRLTPERIGTLDLFVHGVDNLPIWHRNHFHLNLGGDQSPGLCQLTIARFEPLDLQIMASCLFSFCFVFYPKISIAATARR